jgi:hypothetical protein
MFQLNQKFTAMQIRRILEDAAAPAPGLSARWRPDWGFGRIDANRTMHEAAKIISKNR